MASPGTALPTALDQTVDNSAVRCWAARWYSSDASMSACVALAATVLAAWSASAAAFKRASLAVVSMEVIMPSTEEWSDQLRSEP